MTTRQEYAALLLIVALAALAGWFALGALPPV